jgi:hypothetical protein
MPKDMRELRNDLFKVCRRHFREPVARVASELLYCSQYAQYKLRGRPGFYKEDAELAEDIGKSPSSIRRALWCVCAKASEECTDDPLFLVAYGPRPWERSGRSRWLHITTRGKELIREALLIAKARDEKRQNAYTDRSGKARSVRRDCMDRSAQNGRTLLFRKTLQNHIQNLSHRSRSGERKRIRNR